MSDRYLESFTGVPQAVLGASWRSGVSTIDPFLRPRVLGKKPVISWNFQSSQNMGFQSKCKAIQSSLKSLHLRDLRKFVKVCNGDTRGRHCGTVVQPRPVTPPSHTGMPGIEYHLHGQLHAAAWVAASGSTSTWIPVTHGGRVILHGALGPLLWSARALLFRTLQEYLLSLLFLLFLFLSVAHFFFFR